MYPQCIQLIDVSTMHTAHRCTHNAYSSQMYPQCIQLTDVPTMHTAHRCTHNAYSSQMYLQPLRKRPNSFPHYPSCSEQLKLLPTMWCFKVPQKLRKPPQHTIPSICTVLANASLCHSYAYDHPHHCDCIISCNILPVPMACIR